MEEIEMPANGLSPCVRLFVESLLAEAASIAANHAPADFSAEVRDAQTRVWSRFAGQSALAGMRSSIPDFVR
jgi:hypothetical protein